MVGVGRRTGEFHRRACFFAKRSQSFLVLIKMKPEYGGNF
jgi:hypothetical protein